MVTFIDIAYTRTMKGHLNTLNIKNLIVGQNSADD